jgi:hypothetical protein
LVITGGLRGPDPNQRHQALFQARWRCAVEQTRPREPTPPSDYIPLIVKKRLDEVLQALLAPIRNRRRALARDPGYVLQVVKRGTARAREITDATLRDVRAALGLFMLN